MAKNTILSSSELYAKKTNRRLLIIGIVALLGLLFGLLILTSTGRRTVDVEKPTVTTSPDALLADVPSGFDLASGLSDGVALKAYPENVQMKDIVIGSAAEAVVTLTASGGPIRLEAMDLAEVQQDGFIIDGDCKVGDVIAMGSSCNLKVLWNPVSIRSYSNYLNVRWRLDDPTAFPVPELQTLIVNITGQSIDSVNCVVCEERTEDKIAKKLGTLDEKTGLYIKNGEIMDIVQLDKIAISLDGVLLGKVTKDTNEVVNEAGEVIGRVLGDDTVVSKDLTVLGGALNLASVLDSAGNVIGRLTAEGTVVDTNDRPLGVPMADGSIVGLDGRIIGSVMPWSVILNLSSKAVGATQLDGSVLLANGQKMGRILPGGLVVNDNGVIVGGTVSRGLGIGHSCHSLGAVAGNGKIYNMFDQQVGYTTIDGLVLDMAGAPAGSVVREGLIIDLKGEVIAFVNSEGKAVSKTADLIGCMNPDGSVAAGKDVVGAIMPRGRVIGYDLSVKGLTLPNGSVVRPSGEVVGRVLTSGYVFDLNDKVIGAVIPKGTAVAPGCVFLGILDLNGQVLNAQGVSIGCVDPDKKVLNSAREIIGGVTPMGAVTDLKGNYIGFVLPNGKVIDKLGQEKGCVNPDGTVIDEKGNIIGKVASMNGVVLDANGNPTGWTIIGDKVYGPNGELIGTIIDGKVVNERGEIVGFIPPDGIIVSPEGQFLGRFTRTVGYAMDAQGNKFGRVLPDYTTVSLEKSEIIGALIPDGTQIININNEVIGSVLSNGDVVDKDQKNLGVIRADGSVMSAEGVVLGAMMPTGSVLSWTGEVLGTVQPTGQVLSTKSEAIGVVALNRTVIGKNGEVIGMVFPEASIPLGENGQLLGFLTVNGDINKDAKAIAHITAAGNIFSLSGESVGQLVRLGSVIGSDSQIKGWLSFEGALNNREDFTAIGTVMPDGYAVNKEGMQLGHIIPRQTVADLKGQFAGVVSVNGRVLGRSGDVLGAFPYDNRLMNPNDVWVGRVLPAGVVIDVAGQMLGYTRYDASVVNTRGQVIGQVRYDNRVVNAKAEVIGSYFAYGTLVFDQKGKVLGAVAFDGKVRNAKGAEIGLIVGSSVINTNNEIIGNIYNQGFALNEQGKVTGHLFPNATTFADLDGVQEKNVLTTSLRIVDKNKIIVGGNVPFGIALGLDLSIAGNLIPDGTVLKENAVSAKSLTDSILYDSLDKVVGGVIEQSVMVGRDGRIVGTTSISNAVNDNEGKKIATLMPFGTALSVDNNLIGMVMPQGGAVDDFAKIVGFIAADGSVVKADGSIAGRAMQDGTIVRLLSRDAYGVMPDFADKIASGVGIGLKPELFGRAMPSGDVLDTSNQKIASILDDATLLSPTGELAGALVGFRTAIDHQTNVVGDTTGDGYVTSIKGAKVGKLASNGAIKGKHQLKTLGAVVPTELVAKQCRVQGQVRYDGRIINGNAQVVGAVGLDGLAKDQDGNPMGGIVIKGTVIADGDKGEVLGRTLPDSDVVNMDGKSIGCVLEDGTVIDHDGKRIGAVLKRGIVVDENGNVLGRVLRNGLIVDKNGNVIGHVLSDGTAVDENGNVIGHVVDIKKNHLLYDDNGNIIGSMDKAGRVFDNNGKHLFTVGPDDNLYDPNGNLIGRIDEDGNIYDLNGNKIGDATNWPHYMYDANGNITGYIKDGKIYDLQGNQTGWIDKDGNIYNMDGELVGRLGADGSLTDLATEECINSKYNGEVRDLNGDLLYTIKCGKIYDKDGNLIGYIDENGNMYDLNGNYMGRIGADGTFYDADGNVAGRFYPDAKRGYVSGAKALLAGSTNRSMFGNADLAGRKIAIGDKSFLVLPDNRIIDAKGATVGQLRNGVPYSLSGNLLADELGVGAGAGFGANKGYQQEQLQFDPAQAAAMRDLLARRRAQMKDGVGKNMAKITPDGRVLARAKAKQSKDFGSKTVSSWPVDMSRMILKDKSIPAVLVRSIDSRYMSVPASAIVERNVYAEDGRNIIIPAGSKLIGKVSGSPGSNHVSKMEISWERLIRPDGGQFRLSAVSGDAQGRGGVAAYLDEQWLAKYGKPVLQSTLTSAISYLVATDSAVTDNQDYGTTTQSDRAQAAQDARENFIDDMEMIFQQMIEDASETPAVVFVPSGTRMTVFAMEDLWLRSEEDDEDDYVAEYGADSPAARTPSGGAGRQQRPMKSPSASVADDVASEDYYDPGYTADDDTDELYNPRQVGTSDNATSPSDKKTDQVKKNAKSDLEQRYRSRQGLSSYDVEQKTAAPLRQKSSGATRSSSGSGLFD